jgi:hypothetical protein
MVDLDSRLDMVRLENLCGGDHVLVGESDLPTLSLRPNHALGLENLYPHHFGVVGNRWYLDANTMEYLVMKRSLT